MPEVYIYQFMFVMLCAVGAITLITAATRSDYSQFHSPNLFYIYFLFGSLTVLFSAIKNILAIPGGYQLNLLLYLIVNILLWIAIKRVTLLEAGITVIAHAGLLLLNLLLPDMEAFLPYFALYLIVWYGNLAQLFFRQFQKQSNIGANVFLSGLLAQVLSGSAILYLVYVVKQTQWAITLIPVLGACGFLLIGIGYLSTSLICQHRQLQALAMKDPLTQLVNRRGLYVRVENLISLAQQKEGAYLVAITLDLDHFKDINDTYGHAAGDKVIREVAKVLMDNARADDLPCRLGGEEFLLLLVAAGQDEARKIAERLRESIAALEVAYEQHAIRFTLSAGVSAQREPYDIDLLLKAADKALYKAKEMGRNRVCYLDAEA